MFIFYVDPTDLRDAAEAARKGAVHSRQVRPGTHVQDVIRAIPGSLAIARLEALGAEFETRREQWTGDMTEFADELDRNAEMYEAMDEHAAGSFGWDPP